MRLGFGVGTIDVGFTGGVSDAADGGLLSSTFLSNYGPYGMVMDFTDASISINDETDVLDYSSQGTVSATTGAPLGPWSKLTYSAPSAKLTEQADGFLAFQAHNLLLQSENMHATWSSPESTVTATSASTIRETSATNIHRWVQSALTTLSGGTYQLSIEIQADGRSLIGIYTSGTNKHLGVDLSAGTIGSISSGFGTFDSSGTITPVGDNWYRLTLDGAGITAINIYMFTAWTAGGVATFNYAGNTGLGLKIRKAHLRRTPSVSTYVATTSAAVYDLPYVFSGGDKTGILVEPAATNVHVTSNDLSSAAWTKRGITTATKNQTGPDGIANSACRIANLGSVAGVNDMYEAAYSGVRFTASQAITESFYLRKVTASGVLRVTNASTGVLYYSIDFSILGDDWERITPTHPAVTTGTMTATAGGIFGPFFLAQSGTLDFDIYCPQLETGTVATSPIITYGSSVVRAVDTDTSLLNLFPSLGSAYTMYIRYKPASTAVATTGLRLDDTTANELVSIGNNASGQGLATVTDGGVSQASITSGTITSSAFHRLAVSVEANNVLFVVNGGTAVQDASVTLPTLTRMLLGNTSGQLITQIALFPGARTEAQLQAIGA